MRSNDITKQGQMLGDGREASAVGTTYTTTLQTPAEHVERVFWQVKTRSMNFGNLAREFLYMLTYESHWCRQEPSFFQTCLGMATSLPLLSEPGVLTQGWASEHRGHVNTGGASAHAQRTRDNVWGAVWGSQVCSQNGGLRQPQSQAQACIQLTWGHHSEPH